MMGDGKQGRRKKLVFLLSLQSRERCCQWEWHASDDSLAGVLLFWPGLVAGPVKCPLNNFVVGPLPVADACRGLHCVSSCGTGTMLYCSKTGQG